MVSVLRRQENSNGSVNASAPLGAIVSVNARSVTGILEGPYDS